jgi:Protein of unknown function (DUF3489)
MLSKREENIMAKFTDTQLIVLSAAGARDDGIAVVPARMNGAAASKVGASLVTRKLMREVRSKPGMPVWRKGGDDGPISLLITRAGRDAIGVEEKAPGEALRPFNAQSEEKGGRTLEKPSQDRSGDKDSTDGGATSPRSGTKLALVIEMLGAKKGATLDMLIGATGWLPHTTRAALTGLRKRGFSIERTREEESDSIYRIVSASAAAAA